MSYYHIYTDGAHSSKTNVGGWGVVVCDNDDHEIMKYGDWEFQTTNNRMELTAVLHSLQCMYDRKRFSKDVCGAVIYTDSAYIANCFKDKWYDTWRKNGWKTSKKTDVLNKDLWEKILTYYEYLDNITIAKVSGHSDNTCNNLADALAVACRTEGASFISKGANNENKK